MKKQLLIIVITLCFNISARAQGLEWAKSMGGTGNNDIGNDITVDAVGNVYVTGVFTGMVDFDPGIGTFYLSGIDRTIFIQKLDVNGNFVWAKSFGNTSYNNEGLSVAVDNDLNVYVTGQYTGTIDFDPGLDVYNLSATHIEPFLLKLNSSGGFVWAKCIAGCSYGAGSTISLDNQGFIFTAGYFSDSIDVDPGAGVTKFFESGSGSAYILKLDTAGSFVWAKQLECSNRSRAYSLCLDAFGYCSIAGEFKGTCNFDLGNSNYTLSATDDASFILKLDTAGNFQWVRHVEPSAISKNSCIVADRSGNTYTTGGFTSTVDFDPGIGVFNLTAEYAYDAFILKLDSFGNFIWAKQIKVTGDYGGGTAVAVDTTYQLYIVGFFSDTADVDPGAGVHTLTCNSLMANGYLVKLDSSGTFGWATSYANDGPNTAFSIVADDDGNVFAAGIFNETVDFDPGSTICDLTSNGNADIFIQKLSTATLAIPSFTTTQSPITIYPNPATKTIHISAQDDIDRIIVTDMLGKKVHESPTLRGKHTSVEMNTPGMYFILVTSGENINTQKILVTQ